MNYSFPKIENIKDVLPAIEGMKEFIVVEKPGYTVINYNVVTSDTFPDVNPDETVNIAAIRRELRGIIFDSETGNIIRRPYHKFFNVGERTETQEKNINLSKGHIILSKLDGSMISPFIANDQLIFGTKLGATDVSKPVETFVKQNPKYNDFSLKWVRRGWTPIFEWCSRKQKIVLDYSEDQLILTAMRYMVTGGYLPYDVMVRLAKDYDIPVVNSASNKDAQGMAEFVNIVRNETDTEGYVICFDSGHMLKVKTDWYVAIHRAKEAILRDRHIVRMILEDKLDDVKAQLPDEDRIKLSEYEADLGKRMVDLVTRMRSIIDAEKALGNDRKEFALGTAKTLDNYTRSAIFNFWDSDEMELDTIRRIMANNIFRDNKWEALRGVWFPGLRCNGETFDEGDFGNE